MLAVIDYAPTLLGFTDEVYTKLRGANIFDQDNDEDLIQSSNADMFFK